MIVREPGPPAVDPDAVDAPALRPGHVPVAILLDEVSDVSDTIRVAERIRGRLMATTMLDTVHRSTTASIGVAMYNGIYTQPQEMLRDADSAMYRAKAQGGGRYQIFDTAMYASALALLQLEADMKRAVEDHEWQVYYQPIISLVNGKATGVEALVRWMHPTRGMVPPLEFISVAEETGFILPIGEYVLRTACAQIKAWRDAGQFRGGLVHTAERDMGQASGQVDVTGKSVHGLTDPPTQKSLYLSANVEELHDMTEVWGRMQ